MKARPDDIKLLKNSVCGHKGSATLEFNDRFPDGYKVKITKVNDDGTFEGKLNEIWPCM